MKYILFNKYPNDNMSSIFTSKGFFLPYYVFIIAINIITETIMKIIQTIDAISSYYWFYWLKYYLCMRFICNDAEQAILMR